MLPMDLTHYHVLSNGDAEVLGNFRALNFYRTSDMRIKFDSQKLTDGKYHALKRLIIALLIYLQ